jgi:DDE superfamily endonuclease
VDHQPRSRVRTKKSARDRLIRLAARHPAWALGFQDEVWWSRLARPSLQTWAEEDDFLRLVEQAVAQDDPEPKALACYGLLLRADPTAEDTADQMRLRFVDGRPVSAVTTAYLDWCCRKLHAAGKEALLLIWDNAPWHVSQQVRAWIRDHNRQVKQDGVGVRIIACYLPIKSPWLNAIEATWVHGKRRVVEADRLLSIIDCSPLTSSPIASPMPTAVPMNLISPFPIRPPDSALGSRAAAAKSPPRETSRWASIGRGDLTLA